MHLDDPLVEAISPAAQATLGRIATAHPWIAGFCVLVVAGAALLGLVSGAIRPESLTTPRRRALARIALRFGLAAKGSMADVRIAVTNREESAPTADPLTIAAGSVQDVPVPAELVARARALPPAPAPLPPPVAPPRPVSRASIPREDPTTVPPPAPRPRSQTPASPRRLPSNPGRARSTMPTPLAVVHDDDADPAATTPPEVPRPRTQTGSDLRPPTPRPPRGRG